MENLWTRGRLHRPVTSPLASLPRQRPKTIVQKVKIGSNVSPEQRKQLRNGLQGIKRHIFERRRRYERELKDRTSYNDLKEKSLANLSSEKSRIRWKAIQNKLLFLSLQRRILRNARNFGLDSNTKISPNSNMDDVDITRRRFIIYPDSIVSKLHTVYLMFLLIYLLAILPLDLAFTYSSESRLSTTVGSIFTLSLLVDIGLTFLSAVEHRDRAECRLEDRPFEIAKRYVKTWLLFDIATAVPAQWLVRGTEDGTRAIAELPKLFRLLNYLFQITPSKERARQLITSRIKALFGSSKYSYIGQSLLFTLVFIHVCACLWCMLLHLSVNNWMLTLRERTKDYSEPTNARLYLLSIYYVVSTIATVGFGDISANSLWEKAFVCLFILVGVWIYTNTISFFSQILADPDLMKRSKQFAILGELVRLNLIPNKIHREISDHIENMYEMRREQKSETLELIEFVPLAYQMSVAQILT